MTDPTPDVKSLFGQAHERPAAERAAFLDAACAGHPAVRAELDALLGALDRAGDFLNPPAAPAGDGATLDAPAADSAATRAFAAEERPGVLIAGRYKLLQQIGEGGMGSVWMADQIAPVKRRVAVKLIRDGRGDSKAILSRFEAERQAIALMDHPHIAKLLDAGTSETGQPFFVMELVKGVPLTDYCDAHRLSIPDRLALFQQICGAVQHAHQKGIIHRDLKPTNILVESHDGKPVPKVIDFGLAKATSGLQLTDHTLFTAFGSVLGTPLYMAPEQATFNAVDVDTRADVYALGVVLYELLTGSTPLTRETVKKAALDEMLKLIREQEAPTPSSRLSTTAGEPAIAANRQAEPGKLSRMVKGELDWIVLRALAKERERRYESAAALARDVGRHLTGEAVEACPPTLGYRLRKAYRRNKVAVWVSTAFTLLITTGGVTGGYLAVRATAAERVGADERDAAIEARRREAERADGEAAAKREAEAAKAKAETEAAISKQINEFLRNDLLGQGNTGNQAGGGNPHLTVRQALQNAITKLEGQFAGQPLVEATIRQTIAETCLGLGRESDARTQLEKACALREAHLGADHPDTVATKMLLVDALIRTEQWWLPGSATFGEAPGPFRTPGEDATWEERTRRAKTLQAEIHAALLARFGPEHLETQIAQLNVEMSNSTSTLTEDFVRRFSKLLASLPEDHPKRELYLLWVAENKITAKSNLAEAEAILIDLIASSAKSRGATHIRTLTLKLKYATALHSQVSQEKWDHALQVVNELRAALRAKFDQNHPLAVRSAVLRSALITGHKMDRGDTTPDQVEAMKQAFDSSFAAAEAEWRKLESIYGPDDPESLRVRTRYANMLHRGLDKEGETKRLPDAARQWRAIYTTAYGTYGPDDSRTRELKAKMEACDREIKMSARLASQRDPKSLLDIARGSPEFLPGILGFIMLKGEYDPALLTTAREVYGPQASVTTSCLHYSIDYLLRMRNFTDSERVLREHIALLDKTNLETWATGVTRALLGEVLMARELNSDARKLLAKAWENLPAADAENHNRLRQARVMILDRLVRLEEASGRPVEAAKWRKEYDNLPPERAVLPKPPTKVENPTQPAPKRDTPSGPDRKPKLPIAPPPGEVKQ